MSARYSALRTALRAAGIMLVFTLVFTAMMASTYRFTRPAIEASMQEAQMRLIDEVLAPGSYDNDLPKTSCASAPHRPSASMTAAASGAPPGNQPVALIVETATTDGYAGRIAMVVAIIMACCPAYASPHTRKRRPGRLHRPQEGPPQGHALDRQFSIASWKDVNTAEWALRKDGGSFGYRTGATISARAVVGAVGRATAWASARQDDLFSAPAGSTLGVQP